jgi:hypothetical protein
MSTERTPARRSNGDGSETPATPHAHPAGRAVGPVGTILLIVYLLMFSALLLYGMVAVWPSPTPVGGDAPKEPKTVLFFVWTLPITEEVRLFLIVALTGALGGLVHTLRSLYWYVGNRNLVVSWLPMYILKPLVGTTLGLVFYLVFRGGLFSSQADVSQTSPFGFAALATLVGMFSEQAVEKLKQAASTLLAEPPMGEDHEPPRPVHEAGKSVVLAQGAPLSNGTKRAARRVATHAQT